MNMEQDAVRRKDEELTGRDLPNADGMVSDEDVNAVDDDATGETGQDHSLDNYESTLPDDGVGAVQDASDTTSDVAHTVD
jgi:hypothetical protein